jgi:hypothetical protein
MRFMRCLLAAISMWVFCIGSARGGDREHPNPLAMYSKEWQQPRYGACNTGKDCHYLSDKEKDVLYILNMARMNPALFGKTVAIHAREICFSDTSSTVYYKSLIAQLRTMKPMRVLVPDSLCFVSALCHATTSGANGYTGHERQSAACKRAEHFDAECCQYGSRAAVDIVLSLLVDEGVEDLGHRSICLGNYTAMSPCCRPHKKFDIAAVLDFRR